MIKKLPLLFFMFLFISINANAQYNLNGQANAELIEASYKTNMNFGAFPQAKNRAQEKYERMLIRQERNFFETKNALYITQLSYNNWAEGGENSFNGKMTSFTKHVYKNKNMTVDSYLNMAYAVSYQPDNKKKLEDYFELNSSISYLIWGRWSYSFGFNVKSQFSKTEDDKNEKYDYKSTFFAPGNVKPYAGITYTYDAKRTIMFAPISANFLFVLDDNLSNDGKFGITPGDKMKTTVGFFLNAQWEEKLIKSGKLRYRTSLQSFYNYDGTCLPTLGWENWLDYDIFRFFSINFYVKAIFDDSITDTDSYWQFKESLGFGIAYNFKNK